MASVRQEKVTRLIQKDLGDIIRIKEQEWMPGSMSSVTIVRLSPDLGFAKVYVSFFGNITPKEGVEILNKHKSEIRGEFGRRVKQQLRIVPDFQFYIDDSVDYAEEIDELLKK